MTKSRRHKQPEKQQSHTVDGERRMVLTGRDRDVFLKVVVNPPAPANKLVVAMKRHRRLVG